MGKDFESLQSEFYHYMVTNGGIAKKTSRDYISRLKFLVEERGYNLDSNISHEYIDEIMNNEEKARISREKYSTRHAMGDFRAGLNKFLAFVNSDYKKKYDDSIIAELDKIQTSDKLKPTEKESIIQSRIGQGSFRRQLLKYWHGCSVSSCNLFDILIASHIKPWRDANNFERLDVYNGLLLLPNYDKLFDLGYMSFDSRGLAIYSKLLSASDKKILGLKSDLHLVNIEKQHKKYLKYHNEHCFME